MKQPTDSLLNHLSGEEALRVLRSLCASDSQIRSRILAEAERVLSELSPDEVAEELFAELDLIDVEDLWDRAGASRDGYSSPAETAAEMIDEVLRPFTDKLEGYRKTGMPEQRKLYCMGLLKGLYRFAHGSDSEFVEWAADLPMGCFAAILNRWRQQASKGELEDMTAFLVRECTEWAE